MTLTEPAWAQTASYDASEDRAVLAALAGARWPVDLAPVNGRQLSAGGGHGVIGDTDLAVTANATPNMTVQVAAGQALVRGTQQGTQGVYVQGNDAVVSGIAIAAAPASNSRRDLVVLRVQDTAYGDASTVATLEVVTGTAAASPALPTPPENTLALAEVAVAAGQTTVAAGNITDLRVRAYTLGGVAVCTSTTRPGAPSVGQLAWEIDQGRIIRWDGTVWKWLAGERFYADLTGGLAVVSSSSATSVVLTVAVPAQNIPYRVQVAGQAFISQSALGDEFRTEIWQTACIRRHQSIGTGTRTLSPVWVDVPAGGAVTFTLRIYRVSGAGTGTTFVDQLTNILTARVVPL